MIAVVTKSSQLADATGDGGGLEDDDSPGPELPARLEGPGPPSSPLRHWGWGPGSPSVSGNV